MGKRVYQNFDQLPGRFGIPVGALSDLPAWEGLDPVYWCNQGFDLIGPMLPGIPLPPTCNHGVHIIHTGGKYDSYLLVPTNAG